MGRSVSTPRGATLVAYDHIDFDEEDFDFDFDCFAEDARDRVSFMAPSMRPAEGWAGREDCILAENGHATFGVSEYCGLLAYWMIPKSPLGEAWINRIAPRFDREFGSLRLDGYMSNGCGVFYRINR